MNQIMIDQNKCIGCSLCVKDCPGACLYLENGKAHVRDSGCIECGHCYAICPENAVRMSGYACNNEPVTPMTEISSDTLLAAIKSRRSVRRFNDEEISTEDFMKIIEAGRYSPTGGNAQNVAFTVLGSKQQQAESICVDLFRKGQKIGAPFVDLFKRTEITDDFFFKGAPKVILVSSSSSVDASLASAYMEIMAESLGLGVLYSGFFIVCMRFSPKLSRLIPLPKGHKPVTCLIIGHPDVKYQRIAPRKDAKLTVL